MLFHMENFQMREENKKLEGRNNRKSGETVRKKRTSNISAFFPKIADRNQNPSM